MHPDDLLEQLNATANTRKQKNLDLIHAICREQYERGSRDFKVDPFVKTIVFLF